MAEEKNSNEIQDSTIHSNGKLFVGGISWLTTKETFTDYFSKYGEITDSVIMMDKHTRKPRGFGFVTFYDPSVADMVLNEKHVIDGRAVELKRTVPKPDMNDKLILRTKKIFVGGLPPALTEGEFKDYFSTFGTIIEHQIMIDYQTMRSRGFGFITYDSEDAVENIFARDEKHELGGKQVEIKKAVPKRVSFEFNSNTPQTSPGYDVYRYGGLYDGSMDRAFGAYDLCASYTAYASNYANFYNAYCHGLSYDGSMYTYGIDRYGMNGYGVSNGYGGGPMQYHSYWY